MAISVATLHDTREVRPTSCGRRVPVQRVGLGTAAVCLAILSAATHGCNRADGPPLGKVSGVVTLDGQPLADAIITFAPPNGRPSQGITGSDGRYTLAYTAEQQGAMVGDHVVRISTERYVERSGGAVEQMVEKVPTKYHAESTLTATVKAGTNELPFDLRSK